MAYETILYEKDDDGIATLTFNRPEVMNAGNLQLYAETRHAMEDYDDDSALRVLILTGAGKAFQAGDDVKEVLQSGDLEERRAENRAQSIRGKAKDPGLPELHKPTIAAVNGPAIGYGMDISMQCDIRIASENAKFGYLYVRRGLNGTESGPVRLTHIIGLSRALEMMLSGEMVDANEAERIGLVRMVVPQDKLMDEAKAMARKLMQGAPLAQTAIKRAVHKALYDPKEIREFAMNLLSQLIQTDDHKEGVMSFLERREPAFKGR